ncbi:TPA: hypothetical protein RZC51_003194 [Burkholderia cenocepacia]|nr:hypothetical protein [Burkholderia cenocepacia]
MTTAKRRSLAVGIEQSGRRETSLRAPPPTGSANDKKRADVAANHKETRRVLQNKKQAEGS